MLAGIHAVLRPFVDTHHAHVITNQSVLLIDTQENYFDHIESKGSSIFTKNSTLTQTIILMRDPAETLVSDFISQYNISGRTSHLIIKGMLFSLDLYDLF